MGHTRRTTRQEKAAELDQYEQEQACWDSLVAHRYQMRWAREQVELCRYQLARARERLEKMQRQGWAVRD